jgi:anti-sigma factor RsiW
MKHDTIERLIQQALDHELSDADEQRLIQHLNTCQECRKYYEQMMAIHDECRLLNEIYPQPGFNKRVMQVVGFHRRAVWKNVAAVCASSWLAGFIALIISPLPGFALHKMLTSMPAFVQFMNNCETAVRSLTQFAAPIVKMTTEGAQPAIGIVVSIIAFYLFAKIVKKEVKCRA